MAKKIDLNTQEGRDRQRASLERRGKAWRTDFHNLLVADVKAYKASGDVGTFDDRMNKNVAIAGHANEAVVQWAVGIVGMLFDKDTGTVYSPGDGAGCEVRKAYRAAIDLKLVNETKYYVYTPPKATTGIRPFSLKDEVMRVLDKAVKRRAEMEKGTKKATSEDDIPTEMIVRLRKALFVEESPASETVVEDAEYTDVTPDTKAIA